MDFYDGRIIRILPKSAKHQLQKVEELRQLIDTNLGFPNVGLVNPHETHFYLFVSSEHKKIVGCVIAEPVSSVFLLAEINLVLRVALVLMLICCRGF